MIGLLGSHGYIGSAFAREMDARGMEWVALDYRNLDWGTIDECELVINCAAFIPKESVALCDKFPNETMLGNVILPKRLAVLCHTTGTCLAHISTGCLWSDGREHNEYDAPDRSFNGHCGFYIGTKVLAEEVVFQNTSNYFIWRVRLPFDEVDCDRNYLSKLARFDEVFDHDNTICHRGDFVKGCLDLWQKRAPFGAYHVMNPGHLKASYIMEKLMQRGIRKTPARIVPGPQGGSLVSVKKMLDAGVVLRPVEEALEESLKLWKPNV